MSRRIFISYRRDDEPVYAGRLFDSLQNAFGSDRVFMDVGTIGPRMDLLRVLEEEVAKSDVLLAVIGSRWIDALDSEGKRRLDNPEDLVRFEIEAALKKNKLLVPVLVGYAEMPDPEQLPEGLRMLAGRQAVRIRHERFKSDANDLIERLRKLLDQPQAGPPSASPKSAKPASRIQPLPGHATAPAKRQSRHWSVAALILLAAAIGAVFWQKPVSAPADPPQSATVSKPANDAVPPAAKEKKTAADEPKKIRTLAVRGDPAPVPNDFSQSKSGDGAASPNKSVTMVRPKPADRIAQPSPAAQFAALAQRAILYDEDPTDPKGKQYSGTAVWRTEQVRNSAAQASDIAIRADIEIPDRKLKMTLSFRRNTDPDLPASHTAELTFIVPADFADGGVGSVPGILLKSGEQARGTALAGVAVKVTDGFFMVGLSNVAADVKKNLDLLKTRAWLDVPMVYKNQHRAILAFEKGGPGERAFAAAFAAWEQPAPAAAAPVAADPAIAGVYVVQVASQRSEADAQASYRALQGKFPALLGPRSPLILRADLGDQGIYYRVVIGPFDTSDAATQLCEDLKVAGGQCAVRKN
jgi:hypothetical protein